MVAFCYLNMHMGQPVKLSDQLVLDARLIGEVAERSIAGQIEHWAQLGRAIEPLLRGAEALALKRSGARRSLADCLETVDSEEGRARTSTHLATRPFPHYEAHPTRKGLLVRTEEDGTRTEGRFVHRVFQPSPKKRAPRPRK